MKKNKKENVSLQQEAPVLSIPMSLSKRKVKVKNALKTIKNVIAFGKPFHGYLYLAIFFVLISTFCDLMVPVFLGRCINCLIGPGMVDFKGLLIQAGIMMAFVVGAFLTNWLQYIFTNEYNFKTTSYMREKFFEKLNKVPLSFIDNNKHGDLLSRMINDIDILTDGVSEGLATILSGIVTIGGTIVFMFVLNVPLAIVVTLLTPISLVLSMYIAKKSYNLFAKQAASEGEINGYLEEFISGSNVVKAFNFENQALESFDEINKRYYKVSQKAEFYSNLAGPVTRFINGLVYVIVAIFGIVLAINGNYAISIGLISTFLSYANSFGKPFNELAGEITELQAAFASSERVFSILEAKEEKSDVDLPELTNAEGEIEVKNAYFSYVPSQKLIQNFNLSVKPGQKVAIVGPTGCGKTTFINLLMRFYELTDGSIYIDGTNISEVKRASIRNKFGMVLQESWLYNATIRDNIAYGKPNATLDEIIEVSKLTGVDDFVKLLPKGYNTMITEGGSNVSEGQKQLICITRIMLTKPPMLILDEATSNIDTRTELKIQEAFDHLMKGRTTFIVAHRLSTIKTADIILVMNKGNVIEQGTHESLLAKKGFYYNLYNSQFAKNED